MPNTNGSSISYSVVKRFSDRVTWFTCKHYGECRICKGDAYDEAVEDDEALGQPFIKGKSSQKTGCKCLCEAFKAFSADKAINGVILMDYIPMAMHLQRDKSVSCPVIESFAVVTHDPINDMHAAGVSFGTKQDPDTRHQVNLAAPGRGRDLACRISSKHGMQHRCATGET
ncbi:uncharacterized protein BYT42DRAFT_571690 [Radiomyces spectabilis]|uniref:uncharacterized protein n=1 Tax=Radiomyces spectabilis TaxID=64574 RepID=UPI00221E6603|nr:uncharacterized protein BYT42DRAFT_571690 [Radiomyces spectabilis]KAI8377786.1 hypothetical protein BYT42DRAFT_571690 [Radiomyces spectabilis]